LLQQIQPVLLRQEVRIYLVGGAVRDALLGRVSYDLDFVVPQQAIKVAFHIADVLGVPAYPLDRERDTGRVVLPDAGTVLDVARFRGAALEADLRDRDFTINAMALPAGATSSASIVDPCGGKEDLQAGLVRLTHPGAIDDDPVRALRALRMAARFGFRLTPETAAAVAAAAPQLERVSAERVRDELLKLLQTEAPHRAVEDMADLALLPVVLPEIAALRSVAQSSPHHEPVLAHTLGVLRRLVQVEAVVVRGERAAALTDAEADAAALAHAQAALAPYTTGLSLHLAPGRRRVAPAGRALPRRGQGKSANGGGGWPHPLFRPRRGGRRVGRPAPAPPAPE
jgi:tRNA nucleotidyltransferase/poly(A) polymerase